MGVSFLISSVPKGRQTSGKALARSELNHIGLADPGLIKSNDIHGQLLFLGDDHRLRYHACTHTDPQTNAAGLISLVCTFS